MKKKKKFSGGTYVLTKSFLNQFIFCSFFVVAFIFAVALAVATALSNLSMIPKKKKVVYNKNLSLTFLYYTVESFAKRKKKKNGKR